jgi:hypothetical protein
VLKYGKNFAEPTCSKFVGKKFLTFSFHSLIDTQQTFPHSPTPLKKGLKNIKG